MKIIEDRVLMQHPWLSFRERRYEDRYGTERSWAYVERVANTPAAAVIARTRESRSLILVKQTRIPFSGRAVIEFPAGLIDAGEGPGEAALRELAEETGYRGEIVRITPPGASSAGLTSETIYVVVVSAEERPTAQISHSGSEEIEVMVVPADEIPGFMKRAETESWVLDAKLATFLAMCD